MGFEKVYTVPDWYDGPRRGVADYLGAPHLFESTFNDIDDEHGDEFLLWPLSPESVAIALEDWEIWRRWERAFQSGKADRDSHPALPEDRERHDELQTLLVQHRLQPESADARPGSLHSRDPATGIRATADFVPSGENNGHASLLVRWTPVAGERVAK